MRIISGVLKRIKIVDNRAARQRRESMAIMVSSNFKCHFENSHSSLSESYT